MNELKETIISGDFPLAETLRCGYLRILEGARILPPEGSLVTLTRDGTNLPIAPGVYEGDVVLTVTRRIPLGTYPFRAGVCVMDGKYVSEMSVAAAAPGQVHDASAKHVTLRSQEESFNGFYIGGNSQYTIEDAHLSLHGNGGNDFVGFGAGLFVGDGSKVTLERSVIETEGAARGTIFLCGDAELTVNDSTIESRNGVLPADYVETVTPGVMRAVPWMLGLSGNCRAFNLAESATAHFNRCTMRAEGWGVMSTDGIRQGRLYLTDSLIEITGSSGYGAFSINDCLVSLDHCRVKVPDVGLIVANGKASGRFTGATRVDSGRFGVMIFRNTMGRVEVEPGVEFHTGESVFLIKGCTPEISVDGAILHSKSGTLLTVMDTDDPNDTGAYFSDSIGPDQPTEGRDLTSAIPGQDVVVQLKNMTLQGDIFNATTNLKPITGILEPDAPKAPSQPPYSGGPGTPKAGPNGAPPPGGKPGQMPEFFKKLMGMDQPPAKNLAVTIEHSTLRGRVTAGTARHRAEKVTRFNRREIGAVDITPCPSINNGVSLTLIHTDWTVTGVSYLDKLELRDGARLLSQHGAPSVTLNGAAVTLAGDNLLQGKIVITP